MARFSQPDAPRARQVTTVNMATGEILSVAPAHRARQVRRWVAQAERRRARALRFASVASFKVARA
jgi:hypothetical protein